jgi:hypothetical protein
MKGLLIADAQAPRDLKFGFNMPFCRSPNHRNSTENSLDHFGRFGQFRLRSQFWEFMGQGNGKIVGSLIVEMVAVEFGAIFVKNVDRGRALYLRSPLLVAPHAHRSWLSDLLGSFDLHPERPTFGWFLEVEGDRATNLLAQGKIGLVERYPKLSFAQAEFTQKSVHDAYFDKSVGFPVQALGVFEICFAVKVQSVTPFFYDTEKDFSGMSEFFAP